MAAFDNGTLECKAVEMQRYRYSVIASAKTLAECANGSRDGVGADELEALATWLEWRIGEGWTETAAVRGTTAWAYDASVRRMANLALMLHGQAAK